MVETSSITHKLVTKTKVSVLAALLAVPTKKQLAQVYSKLVEMLQMMFTLMYAMSGGHSMDSITLSSLL
jgi:hypothetical protein